MSRKAVILTFLAASAVISGAVSYLASDHPDGLDRSIEDHGLQPAGDASESRGEESARASPLADYRVAGIANDFLSNALAGIIGTLLVLAAVGVLGRLLVRGRRAAGPAEPPASAPPGA